MDHNLMVFIGSLMNIFVIDREVRIFFDKRCTPLAVYALSFLFFNEIRKNYAALMNRRRLV